MREKIRVGGWGGGEERKVTPMLLAWGIVFDINFILGDKA